MTSAQRSGQQKVNRLGFHLTAERAGILNNKINNDVKGQTAEQFHAQKALDRVNVNVGAPDKRFHDGIFH